MNRPWPLLCTLAILAIGWMGGAVDADAQVSQRRFKQTDYETYFIAGRYLTWSPEFRSRGEMEIERVRTETVGGVRILYQGVRTLDVGRNYDRKSRFPFYKIQSEALDPMIWDTELGAYVFRFTDEAFEGARSRVWESLDDKLSIGPKDVERGNLQAFYREADRRAGRDAEQRREELRQFRVGEWSRTCAHLVAQEWEVACAFRHLRTGAVETFYYRRADILS